MSLGSPSTPMQRVPLMTDALALTDGGGTHCTDGWPVCRARRRRRTVRPPRATSSVDELELELDEEEEETPEVEGRVAVHSNGRSSTLLPQAPGEDTVELMLRGPMAAQLLFLQATDITALGACVWRVCVCVPPPRACGELRGVTHAAPPPHTLTHLRLNAPFVSGGIGFSEAACCQGSGLCV